MADTFLVNLDELSRKESVECEGQIKGLITNPRLTINEKGVKQYSVTSFHRYFATTNMEEPWKLVKDDRRHFVVRSSDELIGNKEFFKKCYEMMEDVNVIKTCYEYFKSIPDTENFGKKKMPETEYSADTKEAGTSPIESWIKSLVIENYYEEKVELSAKSQYEMFNTWCKKCGLDFKVSSPQFGVRMKRLNISGIEKGRHTNKGETRNFNIPLLKDYFKLTGDIEIEPEEELDKEITQ
jgi:hypothetical protein